MNKKDLNRELDKIILKVPTSLYDNHSIANIWGMHRLLEIEGISKDKISNLKGNELLSTVYFKWLLAKNKISDKIIEEAKVETKEYRQIIDRPKIIGKIDLLTYGK